MVLEYSISTDKSKLDIDTIHNFLSNRSYWAKGRSLQSVKTSIENSLCFGLYDKDAKMAGFARVVTDKVAFAYLMDVFVLEEYRGKGLGKMLVGHILQHPELQVKLWLLRTIGADGLYEKFGFTEIKDDPARFLAIRDESLF
jgi:GNAT superfamily N-acetyltransferase